MKRRIFFLLFAWVVTLSPMAFAVPPDDPIDEGLWWLYQGRHDRADEVFERYGQTNPQDPAGFFYKAANHWWELAQKLDQSLPEVERRFEESYQQTVDRARALARSTDDPRVKARAYLFEGGAEGLKGRWLVTQKAWVKAYFRGKSGHHLLRKAVELDPDLYDAYMGLGIYDYFTDTLPGVQGVLAYLFIRGDKKRGLEELQLAIDKGHRARIEAKMFLIEIYTSEEKTPEKALALARELRKQFPDSPVMHLTEISVHYQMKQWADVIRESQIFLERAQKAVPYYSAEWVVPARYCLGVGILFGRRDLDSAGAYMDQLLERETTSRWVSFAYLRRGQIHDLRGKRASALRDYRTVLSRPDFWGSHDEASACIKTPFQWPSDAPAPMK